MHDVFGERLKELRKEKGLLGKDLANLIDVEPATITNWEKGKRFPKDYMLIKIADFFNCSIDYLLGRTNNKSSKIYVSEFNSELVEIEINKNYPYELSPKQIEKMLSQLASVGFDIDKLVTSSKND